MNFIPVTSRIKVPRIDYQKNKDYYAWIHVAHWVDEDEGPHYGFHWPCKAGEEDWPYCD